MNTETPRAPRPAATLVVVRDAAEGLEVLLLQRADKGDHNSGAWVFPGGLVDTADAQPLPHGPGLDDATASARLHLPAGGLAYYVAALRETFEEAGLLFATGPDGNPVRLEGEAGERLAAARHALQRGETDIATVCRAHGLQLQLEQLHYIAHWLTPLGRAKRFDTRFFLAVLPPGQRSAHDEVETVQQVWLAPAQALSPAHTRRLMTPTRAVLKQLAGYADTAALRAWAAGPRQVLRVLPRLATGAKGETPLLPGHPAWDEVGRLDPAGRGDVRCEPCLGATVALSPAVRRLTAADRPQHSYLVECGSDAWAVIDPGPCTEAQRDALLAAAPGPLRWIALTDDDSLQAQAAAALQARTGAQLLGPHCSGPATAGRMLRGLRDTSGRRMHYLLASEALLFCGDATPAPELLAGHGVEWLAPRSGFLTQVPRSTGECA